MDRIERLGAALVQNANQADNRIHALDCRLDLLLIADGTSDRRDLSDHAQGFQEGRLAGMAHGNPDGPALVCQVLNDVAADKAGTAKDRNCALCLMNHDKSVPYKSVRGKALEPGL